MALATLTRTERIDLRTNADDKRLLEQAAELRHLSLSSYIISTSLIQAQRDLAETETVALSARDRNLLMDSLENPPAPNEALKGLFR